VRSPAGAPGVEVTSSRLPKKWATDRPGLPKIWVTGVSFVRAGDCRSVAVGRGWSSAADFRWLSRPRRARVWAGALVSACGCWPLPGSASDFGVEKYFSPAPSEGLSGGASLPGFLAVGRSLPSKL
jgi:hypothetical protein